ncbi:MAG: DsrE family protein [Chloroflexi bacterium]|nr:DsrE family protein [Chloroflexota bacterium]
MQKIAIIVGNGSFNNIVLLCTLIAGLVSAFDTRVRVFFRDEALLKLTKDHIDEINFSEAFKGLEEQAVERLQKSDFTDLRSFLRHAKELGEDVKFYGCRSSLYIIGADEADLIPEIDEVTSVSRFILEELADADKVLTF